MLRTNLQHANSVLNKMPCSKRRGGETKCFHELKYPTPGSPRRAMGGTRQGGRAGGPHFALPAAVRQPATRVPEEWKWLPNVNKIFRNTWIFITLLITDAHKSFTECIIKTSSVFHKNICKLGE